MAVTASFAHSDPSYATVSRYGMCRCRRCARTDSGSSRGAVPVPRLGLKRTGPGTWLGCPRPKRRGNVSRLLLSKSISRKRYKISMQQTEIIYFRFLMQGMNYAVSVTVCGLGRSSCRVLRDAPAVALLALGDPPRSPPGHVPYGTAAAVPGSACWFIDIQSNLSFLFFFP